MENNRNVIWKLTIKICSPIFVLILIGWIFTEHFFVFSLDPFRQWLSFGALFILIPFFLYHSINIWNKSQNIHMMAIIISSLSVLIIGPTWSITSDKTELNIYKKDGIKTNGIVVKKWYSSGKSGGHLLKYEFIGNEKTVISFSENNPNEKYEIGDSVQIIYNKKNPEMNKLLESL